MIEQGTPEWHALRLGKVTASRFKDVMTNPRSGKGLSKTAERYMNDLIAEKVTLEPQGFRGNHSTDWGKEHEDDARCVYSAVIHKTVERVGFVERDSLPDVGCSPDGLVDFAESRGGCEIKCPEVSAIHLGYLFGGECPKDHVAQVQGGMWVFEREWWDFCAYDPRITEIDNPNLTKAQAFKLSFFRIRVYRDEKYIDNLAFRVKNFLDLMNDKLDQLKRRSN